MVSVPVSVSVPRERGGEDGEQPGLVEDASLGPCTLRPVALAADVAHLRLALDRGQREEVDHRLLAGRVAELELVAVADGVVGAGVDADAAQDAAALVDLVLLQDARLGHQRAGGARLRAAPAGHARRVVEAHVERRRHQRVEADAHEVVAGGAHDLGAHVGAPAAVDAAGGLAQDERVAVVADVVVVDAREPVLGDGPVARALVEVLLQGLERRAVLDAQAAQVAEPDGLAGALEAAGGLGDGLVARVRDLVLEVARVAGLGLERLEAVARLLDLARERHDREELRLRLRERLAGPDRGEVVAPQVGVHRVGGAAALGDGLDHGRGADPDVAGREHARAPGLEGDGVGLEAPVARGREALVAGAEPAQVRALADGEQDAVAGDDELGARGGLRAATAGRVGLAQLHPDELDARRGAVLVLDHARRAGLEDGGDTLLDGLVDLAGRGHVLHVAAVDERHLAGALADRGADAVHRGEAAAHDHDPGADVARVGQAERGRAQVLQAVDDAVGVLVRDAQLVGVVAADGDDDAVEPLVLEVVEREVPAQLHVAAHLAAEAGDGLVLGLEDLHLGQAVLRDAVAEHAAGGRVALEDRHVVAGEQQVERGAHAGRAGADDRRAPAGRGLLLERQRRVDALVEHRPQDLVARVAVAVADRDRLVHLVPAAVLLARGGAHAAEHAGERDRALEDAHRLAPVGLRVRLEEARDVDVARALVLLLASDLTLAGGTADAVAEHAAGGWSRSKIVTSWPDQAAGSRPRSCRPARTR